MIVAEQGDESFPVGEIIVHPVVTRNVEVGQDPGPSGHLHLITNIWTEAYVQIEDKTRQYKKDLIKGKRYFD